MRFFAAGMALFFFCHTLIHADCEEMQLCCREAHFHSKGHILSLAPEFYHVKRTRTGGTHQNGNPIGIRAKYDHIKRYNIYWGIQGFYGKGTLTGRNGIDDKIKSRWTDEQIEGYLGYTFQTKCFPNPSFTPYFGYGYMRETNKFVSPSPLPLKFTINFGYFAYGFLSEISVFECLRVGANLRFKTPYDPHCKISEDPDFEDMNTLVGTRLQTRVELPITYRSECIWENLELGVIPFYEFRHYGGRENHPFDFFKTKIQIYGADIQLSYRF